MSEVSTAPTKIRINLIGLIINKIKSKDYAWLGLFVIGPIVVLVLLTSVVVNSVFGITSDAAKGKLTSLKLGFSDFDGFKYASSNDDQAKIDLFARAGVSKTYLIAGAINRNDNGLNNIKSLINSTIDITLSVPKIIDYQRMVGVKSILSESCTSLLSISVQSQSIEVTKELINNGKISNTSDCSLKVAIKTGNTKLLDLLTPKFKLSKSDINDLIKSGVVGVTKFITKDNVDKDSLAALLAIDHSGHGSKDHDKIEAEISDAVFSNLSTEIKDEELVKAVDTSKFNIVASLIRQGASYTKPIKPYGYETPISLYEYGIDKKEDMLVAAIINAGFKYEPTVKLRTNGVITTDNLLYYCITSKMINCANTLIDKGFDLSSGYKPSISDPTQFPIVFAAAGDSALFPIITKMINKANSVKELSPENKKKFMAYFLYNFGKTPIGDDIEALKSILTQDVDINSNLYYSPSEVGNYVEGSIPVWSQPLYLNSSYNSITDEKVVNTFKSYIDLIGNKIAKFDFTKDKLTSIGVATNLGQTKLVELMLKSGINPNSPESTTQQTPIFIIALKKNYYDIAKLLLDAKIDLNVELPQSSYSTNKTSYLINFIQSFNSPTTIDGVKLMVENGANVNKCFPVNELEYICPLSAASYENSKSEVTTYLESKGAKCEFVSRGLCKKQ